MSASVGTSARRSLYTARECSAASGDKCATKCAFSGHAGLAMLYVDVLRRQAGSISLADFFKGGFQVTGE